MGCCGGLVYKPPLPHDSIVWYLLSHRCRTILSCGIYSLTATARFYRVVFAISHLNTFRKFKKNTAEEVHIRRNQRFSTRLPCASSAQSIVLKLT